MRFIPAVFFTAMAAGLYAQSGQLSGVVTDAKTQEPLPFANVFVNKTTIGTTTNNSGQFVLSGIPLGSVEIVFSFVGYVPRQLKVMVAATNNHPLTIQLNEDAQQLSEVEIKSSRDKTWERQLKKFEKIFLGTTSNCTILNPWVIEFSNDSKEMKATASIPLEIENRILGYKLSFQLKNFSYTPSGYSIVGNTRFTELTTINVQEALTWMKNRELAYHGSVRHLMKSILDHKIDGEGFVLYKELVKGKPRGRNFSYELAHNLAAHDTASMISMGNGPNEFRIAIKDKMEVHYNSDVSVFNYYVDINYPVSWLEVKGGYILVNKEGTILNPVDVAISGDMAIARVANMLPLDYKPGSRVVIRRPKNISAKRLQEKTYVHTDKSYYYPGDKIWFSAYMSYRASGLRDTLSKVLYVDLINSDRAIFQTRVLLIDSGRASGSFSLPAKMKPGNYVLRAYTQWMRNYGVSQFFYQPIPILNIREGTNELPRKPVNDNLLSVTFDRPEYQKRSKVKIALRLDTTDLEGVISGSFSVTVVDEKLAVPVKEEKSIKNDFGLPELSKEMLAVFSYSIEHGITLHGICKNKRGKGKKTKLTILPENLESVYSVPVLDNGEFSLKDLIFYDSAKFGFQPTDENVVVKPRDYPDLPEKLPESNLKVVPLDMDYVSSTGDTLTSTMLKEVKVTEKRTRPQYDNLYAQPDFYIKSEAIETYPNLGAAIAAKIPDFKLINYDSRWYLIRRRGEFTRAGGAPAEPVLYVDNSLVVGETAGDRLIMINPASIDHIEVKGMIGSNLGANGSNGAVYVYSKRAVDTPFKGLPIIKAKGFDRSMPFSGPNYDIPQENNGKIDSRATLYWNPHVTLVSTHAPVELSFFTSDHAGKYRVIIEGVTHDGNTVHTEAIIDVKE